jgi:uncharacterized phage protein (TIGR01671 family)
MREIKFRAWTGQKMRPCSVSTEGKAMMDWGPSNAPLMQFTGLSDKNGHEIFEGDILAIGDSEHVVVTDDGQGPFEDFSHVLVVEFKSGCFGVEVKQYTPGAIFSVGFWSFKSLIDESAELEIIGNIYEDSELCASKS